MTYQSKRAIASMATGILLLATYVVYALEKHSSGPDSLRSWAIAMLAFIGIAVITQIIVQILFHIAFSVGIAVKERECDEKKIDRIISSSMVEDEMEKLISVKSARIGYICAGVGFVAALAALAFGASDVFALHFLFGAFAAGAITEGGVSIYYHERGVRNG